jgi:hypothetical protein
MKVDRAFETQVIFKGLRCVRLKEQMMDEDQNKKEKT